MDKAASEAALALVTAQKQQRDALVAAELLELQAEDKREEAAALSRRIQRLERVVRLLNGEDVDPLPPLGMPVRQPVAAPAAAPRPEGVSIFDEAKAAAAAGDPLAQRSVAVGEDRNAPPPSNRPQAGPSCPGCGTPGALRQTFITTKSGFQVPAIVCNSCGHQKVFA